MGKDFFEAFPVAKETFLEADRILSRSLSSLIFNGPQEELTQTKNSQVAIYVVSIALWRVFKERFGNIEPAVCAGLSLGEYTAMTVSGLIAFEEGVKLVQARGNYMQEAAESNPGTMAVVLGLDLDAVNQVLEGEEGVWVANLNCPGQIVISGTKEGIERVSPLIKEKGAKRVLPLDVSGAFHSGLMQSAKEKLSDLIQSLEIESEHTPFVMNVTGDFVESVEAVRQNLIDQVVSPVYWEKGVRAMLKKGVNTFIEIGPGKTLTGMNKKIGVEGRSMNLSKLEDLEAIAAELR